MKKIIMLALCFCMSASAENCRVVRRQSKLAVLSVVYACNTDEHLGTVLACRDEMFNSFTQTLINKRSFKCENVADTFNLTDFDGEDLFLCDENNKEDLSCLPPIIANYICCK